MKNTKAVSQSMTIVISFIILLITILFFSSIYSDFTRGAKSNTNIFLEDNFGFFLQDEVNNNTELKEPVPEEFLEYSTNFVIELFETSRDTTLEKGELYFIEPFLDGIANADMYEQFHLMMGYSTISTPGILVYIYNSKTEEVLPLFNPTDDVFLQEKELCILPTFDESPDIFSALVYTINGEDREAPLLPRAIIKTGTVDRLTVGFAEADTSYFDLEFDFDAMYVVSPDRSQVIFKYEEDEFKSNIKIPVYVYDDTVCFLGISTGTSGVAIEKTNAATIIKGDGPLYWSTVEALQNLYLDNFNNLGSVS